MDTLTDLLKAHVDKKLAEEYEYLAQKRADSEYRAHVRRERGARREEVCVQYAIAMPDGSSTIYKHEFGQRQGATRFGLYNRLGGSIVKSKALVMLGG